MLHKSIVKWTHDLFIEHTFGIEPRYKAYVEVKAKWDFAQEDISVLAYRSCGGSVQNRAGVSPDSPRSLSVKIPRSDTAVGHGIEQAAHEPGEFGPVPKWQQ